MTLIQHQPEVNDVVEHPSSPSALSSASGIDPVDRKSPAVEDDDDDDEGRPEVEINRRSASASVVLPHRRSPTTAMVRSRTADGRLTARSRSSSR